MLAHRFLVGCVLVFCVVCIRPLFCVPNVASFSELLIVVLVFCVVCIRPLSCVPNVASFSELLIVVLVFCAMFCVLFVFILSSSCVLCTQCCQFLWNVHSWLPLSVFSNVYLRRRSRRVFMSLTYLSCAPNVVSFSGISILDCHFPLSLTFIYFVVLVKFSCLWQIRMSSLFDITDNAYLENCEIYTNIYVENAVKRKQIVRAVQIKVRNK